MEPFKRFCLKHFAKPPHISAIEDKNKHIYYCVYCVHDYVNGLKKSPIKVPVKEFLFGAVGAMSWDDNNWISKDGKYRLNKFHRSRVVNADTSFPAIIVETKSKEIVPFDGNHRAAQLFFAGEKNMECVKLTESEIDKYRL